MSVSAADIPSSAKGLPVPAPVLALLEHAINKAISLDVSGAAGISDLHDKVVALELNSPPVTVYARIYDRTVRLQTQAPSRVHATISGSPLALARLSLAGDRASVLQGDVTLAGDMDVARTLQKLLADADIDLEEELSRYTGDVVAHQLGNMLRGVLGWGKEALRRLELDTGEYLVEEKRLLASRFEVNAYLDDVDATRADLDRLEQRIQRLQKNMSAKP